MDSRQDSARKFQITWEDGMWSRRELYSYGETLHLPSDRDPDEGWWTAPKGGERVDENTQVTGNATYFGHWHVEIHDVGFDTDGGMCQVTFMRGEPPSDQIWKVIQVPHGSTISSLPTPEKSGYSFLGWYMQNDTRLKKDTQILEDLVVHAHWSAIKYDITYDLGGIGDNVEQVWTEFTFDMPLPYRPPIPSPHTDRPDMEFVDWDPPELPQYTAHDFTFTAIWKTKEFNVTFDPDGGTFDGGSTDVRTDVLEYGTVLTLAYMPAISRTGYDHDGWYVGDVKVDEGYELKVTGPVSFKSHWDAQPRSVYFKWIDDEGVMHNVKLAKDDVGTPIEYDDYITDQILQLNGIDKNPSRTGSVFNGWISDDGISFDPDKPVTDDIVYIARWIGNIRVTFDPTPGTFGPITIPYSKYQKIIDFAPMNAERDGYLFEGWESVPETESEESELLDNDTEAVDDISYKAKWRADYVTVTFHSNDVNIDDGEWIEGDETELGGETGTAKQVLVKNQPTVLDDNPFNMLGFKFIGWTRTKGKTTPDDDLMPSLDGGRDAYVEDYDLRDGVANAETTTETDESSPVDSGVEYEEDIDQPNKIVAQFSEDTDLYAVWERQECTILFNPNGGHFTESASSTDPLPMTIEYGKTLETAAQVIPTVDKDGCNFDGWCTYWGIMFTKDTIIQDDIILYAHWKDGTGNPDQDTTNNTVPTDEPPQPQEDPVDYNNPKHFKAMGGCPEMVPVRYSGPSGGYVRYQMGVGQPMQSCNPFTMTTRSEVYTCKKTGKQCYRLALAKASKTTPSTTSPTWYHKNKVPKYWYLTSGQTKTPQNGAENIQFKPGKDAFIPFEFLQRICGSDGKCKLGFYVYMKEVKA